MKIDILNKPPENIFKYRLNYIVVFIVLLAISFFGILLGAYALLADTNYYSQLENWSLIILVAPTPFITYVGGKLQEYKRLTPPQREKLSILSRQYPEVKIYTDLVSTLNRQPIRVEYNACKNWVENASRHVD